MSTILKALRRLEEDHPGPDDASTGHAEETYPATDPRAADALRERILAEEYAAQASQPTPRESFGGRRTVAIAIAGLVAFAVGLGAYSLIGDSNLEPTKRSSTAQVAESPPPTPRPSATVREADAEEVAAKVSPPAPAQAPTQIRTQPPTSAPTPALALTPAPTPAPIQTASSESAPVAPSTAAASEAADDGSSAMEVAAVAPTRAARAADPRRATPANKASTPRPVSQPASNDESTPSVAAPFEASTAKPATSPITASTAKPATSPITASTAKPATPEYAAIDPQPEISTAEESRPGESRPAIAPPDVAPAKRPVLPDLSVVRTSWHPKPDRRSAKIRLEETQDVVTLRQGDAVGGLVIQEISPSAVLFKAGEVEVRRRVGQGGSRD